MVLRFILVPISVILLSFAWCPKVKKLQIDHDLEFVTEVGEEEDEKFSRYGTQNSTFIGIFSFVVQCLTVFMGAPIFSQCMLNSFIPWLSMLYYIYNTKNNVIIIDKLLCRAMSRRQVAL